MFTHMHQHGSCNSTSCQLLSQRSACTSLPIPESLYKEKKPYWNSYSMYPSLPPSLSLFLLFSHHWLCPNLATSEGWLSCIWIAQCLTTRATNPHCGSGDSLSYTSNKGKLPVNTTTVSSSVNTLNHTPCSQLQGGNLNLTCMLCEYTCVCVFGGIYWTYVGLCVPCHSVYKSLMPDSGACVQLRICKFNSISL